MPRENGGALKIFQVDEFNYYCGRDAAEAVAAYVADIGLKEATEYMTDFGEPVEVSDSALDRMKIVNIDEPGHPTQTFREALAEYKEAGPFASTEY